MSTSARVALWPYSEAPRAVLADRRGTTNFIACDNSDDSITCATVQRLAALGITADRAAIITPPALGIAA